MNEIIIIIEALVMFSALVLVKKFFGKSGIYVWISLATILANIQLTKSINILGMSATVGNVMFASTFLATDILSECYGHKEAKKGVLLGLFSVIIFIISTQITLAFIPNELDIANSAMQQLFTLTPRICISSIIMFFLANWIDVLIYEKLKRIFREKKIWLRNNICTIICNSLENFGLFILAFSGIYSIKEIIIMAISSSIIESIIALLDTPFLYIARKVKGSKKYE